MFGLFSSAKLFNLTLTLVKHRLISIWLDKLSRQRGNIAHRRWNTYTRMVHSLVCTGSCFRCRRSHSDIKKTQNQSSIHVPGRLNGRSCLRNIRLAYPCTRYRLMLTPSRNTNGSNNYWTIPNSCNIAIALFFQTFVGHGGITTIGANTFSMGITGTFTGFFTFWELRKAGASIWLSAGIGGLVGDLVTYVVAAFELAISLHPGNILEWWGIFTVGYLPTQIPWQSWSLVSQLQQFSILQTIDLNY